MVVGALTLVRALLCALALAPQSLDAKDTNSRIEAARAALATRPIAERGPELAELARLESQVREALASATKPEFESAFLRLLNKSLRARARFDETNSWEFRREWMLEAEECARRAERTELIAATAMELSDLSVEVGRYAEARSVLERQLFELPPNAMSRPFVLEKAAEVAAVMSDFSAALAWLDEAQRTLPEGEAYAPLSWRIPGQRGGIWVELGLLDRAAVELATEWKLVEPLGEHGLKWSADIVVARQHQLELAYARGEHRRVAQLAREYSRDPAIYAKHPASLAALRLIEGQATLHLERASDSTPARSIELLGAAAADTGLHKRDRLVALARLANAELMHARPDDARSRLDEARSLIALWRESKDVYGALLEEAEIAALEMRVALDGGEPEDALRSRLATLRQAIDDRLELWSLTPVRPGGLGFLAPWTRRAWLSELVRARAQLDGPRAALADLYGAQRTDSLVRASHTDPGDFDECARRLVGQGEHTVLIYLMAPERSHVFVLDSAGVGYAALAREDRIEALAAAHDDAASALRGSTVRASDLAAEAKSAAALAAALFPPEIAARIARSRALTICGLELSTRVRLERLPIDGVGRCGDALALTRLPSMSLGSVLLARRSQEQARARALDLLLVVASRPDETLRARFEELVPLECEPRLLDEILDAHPLDRRRVLQGEDATRTALLAENLAEATVVQFISHGVDDPQRERPACLVLAGGPDATGLLSCDDIDSRVGRSAPRLVVLWACRSGAGPPRRGDAALGGLAGAWLAAGAEAVLVADVDLTLETARSFAVVLERALADGVGPAEALRRVRVHSAERDGEAGRVIADSLRLIGVGHLPLFAATTDALARDSDEGEPWLALAAAIAALASVLALVVARRGRNARA